MKEIALILLLFGLQNINAQQTTEPKNLGEWVTAEAPSVFLLHTVLEQAEQLLKESPDGKLVVRICSHSEFYGAFVTAPINPIAVSHYNNHRLNVPNEKIFIALSSDCKPYRQKRVSVNSVYPVYIQYWFVPKNGSIEYNEIYSVEDIKFESFENSGEFLNYLAKNIDARGLITYSSNRRELREKASEVEHLLIRNGIGTDRFKSLRKPLYIFDENGSLKLAQDFSQTIPDMIAIEIKENKSL